MGKCFKTFYHGNLAPSYGNYQGNIALLHQMTVLPVTAVNYRIKVLYHWPLDIVLQSILRL
jgi:hypothetical protein